MVAPELALVDLDGKPVKLSDYAGKPVVLNYWASWCGPCRDEFPELKAALDAHAADGLVVLGVLFKDDVAPAKAFMEKHGATWTTLADPDNAAANAYRVVAPPTTFFIGRDGVVKDLQIGGMTGDQLTQHLGTILQ
jgi:cytochrome c biogenesis protein CcmG/thiol:disulfide interchange protein DsbE